MPTTTLSISSRCRCHWQRPDRYQEYDWDYHNRLSEARVYGAPTTATGSTGPSKHDAVRAGTVRYRYDVLGNLMAREKYSSQGQTLENAEYYVSEQGRELFQFDRQLVLEQYRSYARGVDAALAVDDFDLVAGGVSATMWLLADHQGTVRDLYREGSGLEHVLYDAFGQLLPPVQPLALELATGYRGWRWDADMQLFFQGSQPYDPFTGRWLSEAPAALRSDPANAYTVAGNSPLGQASRADASISHQATASWTGFGELYATTSIRPTTIGTATTAGWSARASAGRRSP